MTKSNALGPALAGILVLATIVWVMTQINITPAKSQISLSQPYARVVSENSKAGAAYLIIENSGKANDRLIGVTGDFARVVQIHDHEVDANGIASMLHLHDGLEVPKGATIELRRGGLHLMLMGLNKGLKTGDELDMVLIFEDAGEIPLTFFVDNQR